MTDRTEQIVRFVERMRDPDIVRPDEETSLRHLLKLHEAEARSAERQQVVEQIRERLTPPPHLIGYSVIVALLDELGEAHRGD